MQTNFSDYIVYVDESGDHSLESVDQGYPVFVLSLCVFHKGYYSSSVIPALESFKFKHFGHDCIILHENEIRKQKGAFVTLSNQAIRSAFLEELTVIIEQSKFVLISCLIDKQNLKVSSAHTDNPYHIALGICLDALYEFLSEKKQQDCVTHVVVECRGKKEDQELELEFRRICDGNNRLNQQLPFNIIFADKKTNSTGLQLA
ncbi:MAG: DUF3800 domain-containing protein, partial [Pseudomonadota bacterium]|nr:DUF3800 domain-containing protein [Pseudomonadota bacterium]